MNEATHNRLYNSSRWRRARAAFLAEHPLCVMCAQVNRDTAASIVDHKIPHKGDEVLFWDPENWQPLCGPCHSRHKQLQEKGGLLPGCDVNGFPLDGNHPWRHYEKAIYDKKETR